MAYASLIVKIVHSEIWMNLEKNSCFWACMFPLKKIDTKKEMDTHDPDRKRMIDIVADESANVLKRVLSWYRNEYYTRIFAFLSANRSYPGSMQIFMRGNYVSRKGGI